MPQRRIASGSEFMCFLREGTEGAYTYRPIAGQTNLQLDPMVADYLETISKNTAWRGRRANLKDWTASVDIDLTDEAEVNANEVDYNELIDLTFAETAATFVFAWVYQRDTATEEILLDSGKRMYIGNAYVEAPISAQSGSIAAATVRFYAHGELSIFNMPAITYIYDNTMIREFFTIAAE